MKTLKVLLLCLIILGLFKKINKPDTKLEQKLELELIFSDLKKEKNI